MNSNRETPTRDQLYTEVWETPMRQLAAKYCLSDVGLAKLLKRMDVPRPPVGYWAKRSAGKAPPKTPLPSLGHALVTSAIKQIQRGRLDQDGFVRIDARTAVAIRVTRESAERAVRLFAALISAWESAGHRIGANVNAPDGGTELCVGSDSAMVHLIELKEPVSTARARIDNRPRGHTVPPRATGQLAFVLGFLGSDAEQPAWRDSESTRLESMVESIAHELVDQARRCTERRLELEREQRQYQKVHARRTAKSKLDHEEREWEKFVMNAVREWQTAEHIRAYLAAFRQAVDSGHRSVRNKAEYEAFLEWVSFLAVKADPLITTGLRPGEAITPMNTPLKELDISTRLRSVLELIGVRDANDMFQVSDEQLQQRDPHSSRLRKEIERVLFGLGYDVADERSNRR